MYLMEISLSKLNPHSDEDLPPGALCNLDCSPSGMNRDCSTLHSRSVKEAIPTSFALLVLKSSLLFSKAALDYVFEDELLQVFVFQGLILHQTSVRDGNKFDFKALIHTTDSDLNLSLHHEDVH
jgi:hypothetical protein